MAENVTGCPKCGAPLDGEGASRRCRFCGAHLETVGTDAPLPGLDPSNRASMGIRASMGLGAGLFVAAFGILWTIFALSIGAPVPFALFGLVFTGFAVFVGLSARRIAGTGRVGRESRRESDRR